MRYIPITKAFFDNEDIYKMVSQLCDHGASKSDLQLHKEKGGALLTDFTMRGYNYRMTNFQGVLSMSRMQKTRKIMTESRAIARKYDEERSNISTWKLPTVPNGYVHRYQSYIYLFTMGTYINQLTLRQIYILNIKCNELIRFLRTATRHVTPTAHTLEYYSKRYRLQSKNFIRSYATDRLSIALPLYARMKLNEFKYVVETLYGATQCVE